MEYRKQPAKPQEKMTMRRLGYVMKPAFVFAVAASAVSAASAARLDPPHQYAPGIPTLAQLYASSENAPPAAGPKLPANKNVIFLSCGQASAGCAGPALVMRDIAKQIGWKYKIIDGAFGVNDGYNSGMRQAI